jgi:cytochrome c peroxidase
MRHRRLRVIALAAITSIVVGAVPMAPGSHAQSGSPTYTWRIPPWLPPPFVPADNPMSEAKVDLGRHLFYDKRLSRDGSMACATCHEQARAFTDAKRVGVAFDGSLGHRNPMGLANVGYLPVLTWANPNLKRLEVQALVPIFGENPVEMGMTGREQELFGRIRSEPLYEALFKAAFPEDEGEVSLKTITRALASFQRTLISANSPYDRYKYGKNPNAISRAAKRGEELFFSHRLECYHCHSSFNFTDNMQHARSGFPEVGFHNNALYNIDGKGGYPRNATGLAEFTGRPDDMGKFRTPSLRNVAVTAPYMHDGSIATLDEVLDHYSAGGRTIRSGPNKGVGAKSPLRNPLIVGPKLTRAERADLIAFLASLTDRTFLTDAGLANPWTAGANAEPANRKLKIDVEKRP